MTRPLRILYVDDYALDRQLVRHVLESEPGRFVVIEATSREELEARLAEGSYDLVLSDFNILGYDGLQVLDTVKQRHPNLPVVIVTGTGSEEVAAEAIKRGAADYVIKSPKRLRRLPHIILQALEQQRLREERARAEQERQRLLEELQQRVGELTAIYRASQQLQRLRLPADLAQEIIGILEQTLQYEYCGVFLLDEASGRLIPFALGGRRQGPEAAERDRGRILAHDLSLGKGITGWVAQTGQSVRLADVRQDARYYSLRPDIRSELCVPLFIDGRVIGVINAESSRVNAYSEADQRVLETIAAQIAVVIQNARLYERVVRGMERLRQLSQQLVRAQEEERRRLAQELHDEAGQALTALKISLDLIRVDLPTELQQPREQLAQAASLVEETMTRLRGLAQALRPPALDTVGLNRTLEGLCHDFAERTRLAVHYQGSEPTGLADVARIAIYRVLQEALTNVARHASASQVQVTLDCDAERISLTVEDDGVGFDAESVLAATGAQSAAGLGLLGMRERLRLLGGHLLVESRPGQGTRLQASLPRSGATASGQGQCEP